MARGARVENQVAKMSSPMGYVLAGAPQPQFVVAPQQQYMPFVEGMAISTAVAPEPVPVAPVAADSDDAARAVAMAKQAFEKAKCNGFFSHFCEFNEEILKPLKRVPQLPVEPLHRLKAEVLGTLTFRPSSPDTTFVFFNVMALLFGIAESLVVALLLDGGYLSLAWNGALGYIVGMASIGPDPEGAEPSGPPTAPPRLHQPTDSTRVPL